MTTELFYFSSNLGHKHENLKEIMNLSTTLLHFLNEETVFREIKDSLTHRIMSPDSQSPISVYTTTTKLSNSEQLEREFRNLDNANILKKKIYYLKPNISLERQYPL